LRPKPLAEKTTLTIFFIFHIGAVGEIRPLTPLILIKTDSFEVSVSRHTRGTFGLSCALVIFSLQLGFLARHADGICIEHTHCSTASKTRSASITIVLSKECIHLV
jgi:hypothetical protein